VSAPGSIPWLARHELRLAWRDWRSMVTAGGKRSFARAVVVMVIVAFALHLPAWAVVAPFGEDGLNPTLEQLASVSLIVVLYGSLLLSQALEQVTRTLYSRGDLDLVLSSPVPPRRLFGVRIVANAVLMTIVALVLAAPLVDVLTIAGGPRWLAGYGVAVAFATMAAAIAVAVTIWLFKLLGPRRTRVVAQVVAAVVGAAFAIGIQVVAILNYGRFMQAGLLVSPDVAAALPGEGSFVWLPARAILGNYAALAVVMALAAAVLGLVMAAFAARLGEHSIAATDLVSAPSGRRRPARRFVVRSPRWSMRTKELRLLRRDPWLVSQTLTQLLYLIPPALLLTHSFSDSAGSMVIVVMVLVTVGGQLGGALGWLAVSGEDAPELLATAPLPASAAVRGKGEAVMIALAVVLGPLVAGLALMSPRHALFAALGIAVAAASTLQIQMWFRAQARRNHFRRRHTSSRLATLAEAMVSFSWAAAFGLAAAGTGLAAISAVVALLILAGARAVSPRKALA
jgi:ABC-2 type transport system permease protein